MQKKYVILGIVAVAVVKYWESTNYGYYGWLDWISTFVISYGVLWGIYAIWEKLGQEQRKNALNVIGIIFLLILLNVIF